MTIGWLFLHGSGGGGGGGGGGDGDVNSCVHCLTSISSDRVVLKIEIPLHLHVFF